MKRIMISRNIVLALLLPVFCMCTQSGNKKGSLIKFVDPLIGSGGHGHVFVGASVPFGAVQLGPNNIFKGWDWCSGYHYSDSIVIGFSHTHLSGTGGADLGDVLLMPFTGKTNLNRGKQEDISNSYASYFSHSNEEVRPGYYSLLLDKYKIKAELTATERVGIHRYTYPGKEDNHLLIDLKEGIGDKSYETYLKQVDTNTIEGYRFSKGWARDQRLWFVLKSNREIEKVELFDEDVFVGLRELRAEAVKGVVSFVGDPQEVILKVGISPVSSENALANINAEAPDWNFNQIAGQAEDKWNKELSKMEVETPDSALKQVFYTAMFHSFIAPVLFNDADGSYRGTDKEVYSNPGFENYSVFSLWDTYRTDHELLTIVQPERINDFINSMLAIYQQQGKLPQWHLMGNETNAMLGYSAAPVVVDAWQKGFDGFDEELAFEALKASGTFQSQRGIAPLMEYGFIPREKAREATSVALENSIDDRSVAQMAKGLGKEEDFKYFFKRSESYKSYFNKNTGFVHPRSADGSWASPYDPMESIHMVGDFSEGNGWQYTFLVPQDPEGLIELFGGDDKFIDKLDSLFTITGDMGEHASIDITGLIGMYAQGNEPCHHMAYLYAFAGQQWKTAEKVRYILDNFYTNQPDGLIGNEDCGQMSAWYVMSSMGFYPVNPSNGIYVFGSPIFDKTSIKLKDGKQFVIETVNNSKENIYIQAVELNGKEYQNSYIRHCDIVSGGVLKFIMGDKPNYSFGTAVDTRPTSTL
ncbi:GH92 family glycosyl hydrolase [Maribellus sp. YY47]|uniref:GH92 family glycosyl hydrolase n=1 Tax=Maribellus sp. YY47 TaxID=2929486 RepID=UPI0020015E9E|nr:GH92 family glycosyl hydrolase [Maribellus sp. YY47]